MASSILGESFAQHEAFFARLGGTVPDSSRAPDPEPKTHLELLEDAWQELDAHYEIRVRGSDERPRAPRAAPRRGSSLPRSLAVIACRLLGFRRRRSEIFSPFEGGASGHGPF